MKKYKVSFSYPVGFEIEAEDEDEAKGKAWEKLLEDSAEKIVSDLEPEIVEEINDNKK